MYWQVFVGGNLLLWEAGALIIGGGVCSSFNCFQMGRAMVTDLFLNSYGCLPLSFLVVSLGIAGGLLSLFLLDKSGLINRCQIAQLFDRFLDCLSSVTIFGRCDRATTQL